MNMDDFKWDRRSFLGASTAALLSPLAGCAHTENRRETLYALAQREGRVIVHSVLSNRGAQPLIDAFEAAYPGVKVDYDGRFTSVDMSDQFRRDHAAKSTARADVMWSSAMDLQVELVEQQLAATHRSRETSALPHWARHKSQAFCTTLEPVVLVYNKQLLPTADIPKDRQALIHLIAGAPERFKGRVTTVDIERSGVAYMLAFQDQNRFSGYDQLLRAMAAANARLSGGTGAMLEGVNSGEFLIGYNAMGAYALTRGTKDLPNLGVVFLQDYTLSLSRIAFISNAAQHPNAARLWLDYLISVDGQKVTANALGMLPVRSEVAPSPLYAPHLSTIKPVPIRMDKSLLAHLSPDAQRKFIDGWTKALGTRTLRTVP